MELSLSLVIKEIGLAGNRIRDIPTSYTSPHLHRVKSELNRRHYGHEKTLFEISKASQQALDALANKNQAGGSQSLSHDKQTCRATSPLVVRQATLSHDKLYLSWRQAPPASCFLVL